MRALFFIAILLSLSACGFKPILAKDNTSSTSLANIALVDVDGEERQKLHYLIANELNLHPKTAPLYNLKLKISKNKSSMGIMENSQSTRTRVTVNLEYKLLKADDGAIIDQGNLSLYSGYDIGDSEFANYIADDTTSKNILKELCFQLKNRLIMVLSPKE